MSLAVSHALGAWQEPSSSPPGGNVSAPGNISSTGQTKSGALTVQGNLTAPIFYDSDNTDYYVNPAGQTVLAGDVGIGTTSPGAKLQVVGDIQADIIKSSSHYLQQIKLPAPPSNSGPGRWFVRFYQTSWPGGGFIGGRIRVGGIWRWGAIFGVLEREFGAYIAEGSGVINSGESRISATTGQAKNHLRISDLQVVDGWVGVYVWADNTNDPYVWFDGYSRHPLELSSTSWESDTFPAYTPTTFLNGLNVTTGNVGIGTTNPGAKLEVVGDFEVSGNSNTCHLIAFDDEDPAEECPSGYYTWDAVASGPTGYMMCCKVDNPI